MEDGPIFIFNKFSTFLAKFFFMGFGSNGDESAEHWGTEVRQSRSTRPTWEDKNNGTYKDAVVYGHMTDLDRKSVV